MTHFNRHLRRLRGETAGPEGSQTGKRGVTKVYKNERESNGATCEDKYLRVFCFVFLFIKRKQRDVTFSVFIHKLITKLINKKTVVVNVQ